MSRQQATTVSDDTLRRNIGVSAALHFAVLLFLYFGLPVFVKPLPTPYVPIPIDIVDISDITNTRVKEQPEEPPKPPEPPKPEEKVAPPPPQPTPPPPPQAQPEPPKPPPPPEAKPEQVEAITPLPKPEKKPPPPKKVEEKPNADQLARVLKNVEKMKPAEAVKTPVPAKTQTQAQAQPKSMAPSLSDRLTMTEEDALRRQVEQCWNPPIGARNAQTLVVEINITMNPDKTVQSAEVVDKNRLNSDPYFRAAAEAAIRALYNPRCSPLELPDGKYDQWKVIDFTFDPRDML